MTDRLLMLIFGLLAGWYGAKWAYAWSGWKKHREEWRAEVLRQIADDDANDLTRCRIWRWQRDQYLDRGYAVWGTGWLRYEAVGTKGSVK